MEGVVRIRLKLPSLFTGLRCLSFMGQNVAVVLLALILSTVCWSQNSRQSVPPECAETVRVNGSFPNGPFKRLRGESYKRAPTVKYLIHLDGTVSDATIIRSSGLSDMDKKFVDAIAQWKYTPCPDGCGVIESQMTPTIHWGGSQ
jgi:TonB family protein